MSVTFPFHIRSTKIEAFPITIKISPKSNYICYLEKDNVTIRKSDNLEHEKISEIKRDNESILNYGSNHWMQWISSNVISFGTKTGVIFMCDIFHVENLKMLCLENCIIMSTFSAYETLGLCLSNKSICFVSKECVRLPTEYGFKNYGLPNSSIFVPSKQMLLTTIKNEICFIKMPKNAIQNEKKISFSFLQIDNLDLISYNPILNLIAFSLTNGSVLIMKYDEPNSKPRLIIKPAEPNNIKDVVFLKWIKDYKFLIVIQSDGTLNLYNSTFRSLHQTNIHDLSNVNNFEYCNIINSLYFVNKENNICVLEFANIFQDFLFTSSAMITLNSNKTEFYAEPNFYPILNVSYEPLKKMFAISNVNSFFFKLNENSQKINIEGEIIKTYFIKEHLLVFFQNKSEFYLKIFDLQMKEKYSDIFPHSIHTINGYDNKIIVTCHSRFSIIKFIEEPETKKSIKVEENLFLEIETQVTCEQIQNAVISPIFGIVLHFFNGYVNSFPTKVICEKNINYILLNENSNILFLQKERSYLILSKNYKAEFQGYFNFSNKFEVIFLPPVIQFGYICLSANTFLPYLLVDIPKENYPELFESLKQFYDKYELIMSLMVIISNQHHNFNNFIKVINEESNLTVACNIIEKSFEYINEEKAKAIIPKIPLKWNKFFSHLKSNIQELILLNTTPSIFEEILSTKGILTEQFINDFINKLISLNHFIQAFHIKTICQINNDSCFQNCNILIYSSLDDMIDIFEKDFAYWYIDDENSTFRSFGTLLEKLKLFVASFAVFLIIGEQMKVDAILLTNKNIYVLFKNYIETHPNSPYSKFMK